MPQYWQPTGTEKAKLRKALTTAFDEPSFSLLIADYFSPESFANISPPGFGKTAEYRLYEVIEYARMNDWLIDLVAAAHERRPNNAEITAIATDLGLTIMGPRLDNPTGRPFEEIIRENAEFLNPALLIQKLPVLQGQVCWVDIPGGGGTGFLVGPDLVLTNDHVVERIRNGHANWRDVRCRFDYKQAVDGSTLDRKKLPEVKLDTTKWLIDRLPPSQYDWNPNLGDASASELDYGLLRLAEPIGDLPVGGDTVDVQAQNQVRGWIDAKTVPPPLVTGNQVLLLQHPKGKPLGLAIGEVKEFNASGTRLRYDANSQDGSSGSPCFNADLQLVALHHAFDTAVHPPRWNQAIPLSSIQNAWQDRDVIIP